MGCLHSLVNLSRRIKIDHAFEKSKILYTIHNLVKNLCQLWKLCSLLYRLALSCGFQALYGLLAARPSAKSLPAELNARLITAMYDFQPAMGMSKIYFIISPHEGIKLKATKICPFSSLSNASYDGH